MKWISVKDRLPDEDKLILMCNDTTVALGMLCSYRKRFEESGEEVENVTPEHAEIARKSLEEWQNKKAARENNK